MTTLREAAQQALEALEWHYRQGHSNTLGGLRLKIDEKTLRNLKAALAEPVQEPVEPVAYIHRQGRHWEVSERPLADDEKARGWTEEPLYAAPPQRPAKPQGCDHCNHPLYAATKCRVCGRVTEVVQEPVAWRFEARHIDSAWAAAVSLKHPGPEGKYMRNVVPLYAAPPQRLPLTEEEIWALYYALPSDDFERSDRIDFARAIERAHGIKE